MTSAPAAAPAHPPHRTRPAAPAPVSPPPGAPPPPPARTRHDGAPGRLRPLAVPLGVLGAVLAAVGYVGVVDPNEPGHYPLCPLRLFTGLWCPGCGGLRCVHALAHGDLVAALHANAPVVAGGAAFVLLWSVWAVRSARRRPLTPAPGRGWLWSLGVLLAVFTLLRNLPFGGWLHP